MSARKIQNPPSLYLLSDHLDAALAMGEDLLTCKVDLAHGPIASRDMERVVQQNRDLAAFLSEVRVLELTLIARLLQARKWAEDMRRQELRLKPIIQLFSAGTASLPALSGDGTHVAFWSTASDLLPGGQPGLFAKDLVSGAVTQVAVAGLSPDDEPSASTLAALARFVRAHHIATVFVERNLSPALTRTLAHETGAATAVLDTMETLSHAQLAAGVDYDAVLRADLATLRRGLGCT